jgi:hypothetical protein
LRASKMSAEPRGAGAIVSMGPRDSEALACCHRPPLGQKMIFVAEADTTTI